MKSRVALLISLILITSTLQATQSRAASITGKNCPKVNSQQILSGKLFTCVKKGTKRVWDSGIAISKTKATIIRIDLKPLPTLSFSFSATRGDSCKVSVYQNLSLSNESEYQVPRNQVVTDSTWLLDESGEVKIEVDCSISGISVALRRFTPAPTPTPEPSPALTKEPSPSPSPSISNNRNQVDRTVNTGESCSRSQQGFRANDQKNRLHICSISPYDNLFRWNLEADLAPLPQPSNLDISLSGGVARLEFAKIDTDKELKAFEVGVAYLKAPDLSPELYASYSEIDSFTKSTNIADYSISIQLIELQRYLQKLGLVERDRSLLFRVRLLSNSATSPWSDGLYLLPWQVWNDVKLKPTPTPTPSPSQTFEKGDLDNFAVGVEKDVIVFSFEAKNPFTSSDQFEVAYAYLKGANSSPYSLAGYEDPKVVQTLQCTKFRIRVDEITNYLRLKYPKPEEGSLLVRVRTVSGNLKGDWFGNYFFTKQTLIAYQNSQSGTYVGKAWCG